MSGPLAATEWGPHGAEPVVLLHGFMGRSDDWSAVAAGLRPGRRVRAIDLPGHGRSLGLGSVCYTLDGAVEAVLESTSDLGRFTLVGYSMGGRLAYLVAATAPDRVAALIAESAHPGLPQAFDREARLAVDRDRADRLRSDPRAFLEEWYRAPMFGRIALDAGARAALVARRLDGDPREMARALEGLSTGHQPPVWERLRATRVPTLLVAGSADARYATLLGSTSALVRARLLVLPGAGHTAHMDSPGAFTTAVDSFIDYATQPNHSWPS